MKSVQQLRPKRVYTRKKLISAALGTTGIEPNEVDYIKVYETGISLVGIINVDDPSSVFRKLKEDIHILQR